MLPATGRAAPPNGEEAAPLASRADRFGGTALEANRFDQLHGERAARRLEWEAARDSHADLVGTCMQMCSTYERHEREAHFDVSPFEALLSPIDGGPLREALNGAASAEGGSGHVRIDHQRAVKKYHRPAAGNEAPLPEDVRPPPILYSTMTYLLCEILDDDSGHYAPPLRARPLAAPFSDKHKFVRDRTRSIRQDIILQQRAIRRNAEWLKIAVVLHEEMARFHILSGHRLAGRSFADFDPFQNTEQLRKVLQSLQEYYEDIRATSSSALTPLASDALANEAEFRSYQLISHGEDRDVFRQALSFAPPIFASEPVQFALRCVSALHQGDYSTFFKLTRHAPYLMACLLQTHFAKVRSQALQTILRAYPSKEAILAIDVARWLLVESFDELVDVLAAHEIAIMYRGADGGAQGAPPSEAIVYPRISDALHHPSSVEDFGDSSPLASVASAGGASSRGSALTARPLALIEAKVGAMPASQIIRPLGQVKVDFTKGQPIAPLQQPSSATAGYLVARAGEAPPPRSQQGSDMALAREEALLPAQAARTTPKVSISDAVVGAIAQDLLGELWASPPVLDIFSKAIAQEAARRGRIAKARVIESVTAGTLAGICTELLYETVASIVAHAQLRHAARQATIERIAEVVTTEIIHSVIDGACASAIDTVVVAFLSRPPPKEDGGLCSRAAQSAMLDESPCRQPNAPNGIEGVVVEAQPHRRSASECAEQSFDDRLCLVDQQARLEREESMRLEDTLRRALAN